MDNYNNSNFDNNVNYEVQPTQVPVRTKQQESAAKCAKLSLIFTIAHFALYIIQLIVTFGYVFTNGAFTNSYSSSYRYGIYNSFDMFTGITAVTYIVGFIRFGLMIAGLVLMIVARVKDNNNTMAKVLMWIYIVLGILLVLCVILLIVFFVSFAAMCGSLY